MGWAGGIEAFYYQDARLETLVGKTTHDQLDFVWKGWQIDKPPLPGMKTDDFSALYRTWLSVPQSGDYRLVIKEDDRVILFFSGQQLVYDWDAYSGKDEHVTETLHLQAGQRYPLELLYAQDIVDAELHLELESPDGTRNLIPASYFSLPDASFPAQNLDHLNFTPLEKNGDTVIFGDSLAPNWANWSWGGSFDTAYSSNTHGGTRAIKADLDDWAAFCLYFNDKKGFHTHNFDRLSFWLHRGESAGGQSIGVQLSDAKAGWEWMHRYGITVPTDDAWHEVVIPLADIDGVDMAFTRLALVGNGQAVDPVLVDDIRLLHADPPTDIKRDATPAPTTSTYWLFRDERNTGLWESYNADILYQGKQKTSGAFGLSARFSYYGYLAFTPLDSKWDAKTTYPLQQANTLVFDVNRSVDDKAGQNYVVYAWTKDKKLTAQLPLENYLSGGALDYDPATWQTATVPLSQLTDTDIYAVGIQEFSGVNGVTGFLNLDEIRFEHRAVQPPPPLPNPVPGPTLRLDTAAASWPISDAIYGINFASKELASTLGIAVNRFGGNAATRYNWKLDVSNRASDWYFENIPNAVAAVSALPDGSSSDQFVEQNKSTNTQSIITVPLIGWTPKSRNNDCGFSTAKYGAQQSTDPWRSQCGNGKDVSGNNLKNNDPTDTSISIQPAFVSDWIKHLTGKYGSASKGGVQFYSMDNEPMLWHLTHRDVHPNPVGYDEIRDLSYQYGAAVKAADASAQVLGPVLWGWTAYEYSAIDAASGQWSNPPDRNAHGGIPFVAWYLQQMRTYEQQHGTRILDYLDLHFYPQNGVALSDAGNQDKQDLRLRSTRALWDALYTDESWIGKDVQLLPRMHRWVDENYPGTKLALTEYNWGALDNLNGALTQADILGIFGREKLDLATLWSPPAINQPGAFTFRMYRNYDGQGARFGDQAIPATSGDQGQLAVYAARRSSDNTLTVMVINKSKKHFTSPIAGLDTYTLAGIYCYSAADLQAIRKEPGLPAGGANFEANFPPESITLLTFMKIPDTDGDGVPDDRDAFPNDPHEWLDTDKDGIGNNTDQDDDGDGMPDIWEMQYGLNPLDASDAAADKDKDGISNVDEYKKGTNPTKLDTDSDGMMDKQEVDAGRNPLVNEAAVIQIIDRLL